MGTGGSVLLYPLASYLDPDDYVGASLTISIDSASGSRKIGNVFIVVDKNAGFEVAEQSTYPAGGLAASKLSLAADLTFDAAFIGLLWAPRMNNDTGAIITYGITIELFAAP